MTFVGHSTDHLRAAALALVRDPGPRVSASRRLVVEAIVAADGSLSPEQIVASVGGRVRSSDIGSVYRNRYRTSFTRFPIVGLCPSSAEAVEHESQGSVRGQ